MKMIDFVPENTYTCLECYKEFISPIVLEIVWFCSSSHKFKFAFNIVHSVFPKAKKEQKNILTKKLVEVSLNG